MNRLDLNTVTSVTTHSPGKFTLHTPDGEFAAEFAQTYIGQDLKNRLQVTVPTTGGKMGATYAYKLDPQKSGDNLRARFDLK
jgi:hypothetical protein